MGAKEARTGIRAGRRARKLERIDKRERRQVDREDKRYFARRRRLLHQRDQSVPTVNEELRRVSVSRVAGEYGIGAGTVEALSDRGIHSAADVRSKLEEIERIPGIGPGRAEHIRDWLSREWSGARDRVHRVEQAKLSAVSELTGLDTDHKQRRARISADADERRDGIKTRNAAASRDGHPREAPPSEDPGENAAKGRLRSLALRLRPKRRRTPSD